MKNTIISTLFGMFLGIFLYSIYTENKQYSFVDNKWRYIDLPEEYPEITNDTLIAHKLQDTIYFEFLVAKRNNK